MARDLEAKDADGKIVCYHFQRLISYHLDDLENMI